MFPASDTVYGLPVAKLQAGDSIIGQDDREYLIEEITPRWANARTRAEASLTGDLLTGFDIKALDVNGLAVKTFIAKNARLNAIKRRIDDEDAERLFGIKVCLECEEMRSIARYWADDDYICKVCRGDTHETEASFQPRQPR
jgi:hypothetical protein